MPVEPRIRPATDRDIPALARILVESSAYHRELDDRYYRVPPGTDATQRVTGFLADPQRTTLVADQGGAIVGFVELIAMPPPEAGSMVRPQRTVEVGIAVAADHRDRGIGRLLMEAVEALAAERGVELLTLSVQAGNQRAIHLYATSGYRIVGHSMAKWLGAT